MPYSIHAEADFSTLVEGEGVNLYPRGGSYAIPIPNALRGPTRSEQEDPSENAVVAADTEWSLQLPVSGPSPQVGDTLVENGGLAAVILRTRYSPPLKKWKLETRRLSIPPSLAESVDIQRPIVEGGETIGWSLVSMAYPAQVALESISVDDPNAIDPVVTTSYRLSLIEPVELTAGDRFVTTSGDIFLLDEVEMPERLGASLSIRVVPESA
ncbi:MAG: hypothetical protein AAGA92_12075 [Planctomycetota bacterium]